MKHIWKSFLFIALNLSVLLVLLWTLMIYTSLFEGLPWYEPCGMQFLAIFVISDPALSAIGIALLILGRFYHISRLNKLLPFIAIAGLSLPILIDGSLSLIMRLIGTSIGSILSLAVIITTIRNFNLEK